MKSGAANPPWAQGAMSVPLTRIDRDKGGDFMLDAPLIAGLFGHSVEELRQLTGRGLVSSTVETGEDDDLGTWRLTLRCGNRMWQAIVDAAGTILSQESGFTGSTRPSRDCGHR